VILMSSLDRVVKLFIFKKRFECVLKLYVYYFLEILVILKLSYKIISIICNVRYTEDMIITNTNETIKFSILMTLLLYGVFIYRRL